MNRRCAAAVIGTAAVAPMLFGLASGTAGAATPVGSCTNSYSAYTYEDLAFDPAAQAIFPVIDANADGYICFKFYPNGAHAGHAGNLVDNKAAPHR